MDTSRIEIEIGLPIESSTSFKIAAVFQPSENPENQINFHFPCKEKAFARSLQVLLAPYFSTWQCKIEIIETEVVVSVPVSQDLLTEELSIELTLGMKIDSLKQNFLNELLEAVRLQVECKNINQLARLLGYEGLSIERTSLSLSIDPEDIPEEFLKVYYKEIEKYLKYFEVLDAVRPFLKETCIIVQGSVGQLLFHGEVKY